MSRRRKPNEANGTPAATATAEATNGTPPETQTDPAEEKNRPYKTFSCPAGGGAIIEAAVWPREIQVEARTVTVYSVTYRKSYKTDDEWKNTQFLRGSEIGIAIHLLRLAETWILNARTTEDPTF